jgi:transcriptional regulator with XRE-family HTH domain
MSPIETKPFQEIAPRLKALREAVDLTVRELAEKTGTEIQKAKLFESGSVEIPVSYLFKVAQVCGVDLTVLLSGGDAHLKAYTLVKAGQGLTVDRRKDYGYKSLAYRFIGRKMEPFLVTVPVKEEDDLTFSDHPGQEFIHMVEGTLEIRLGKNVLTLSPGDSLYFDSHTPHALRALGGAECRFLDVII